MKKLTSLGVAAFAALVSVLALLGSQSPAQAYPELNIKLEVNRTVLYGGQTFTATAVGNVSCSWTLDWNDEVRAAQKAPNDAFRTTYTAPHVSKLTKIPLVGTCAYDAAENPSEPSARTAAAWTRTIMITVLPPSSAVSPPGSSDLPNAGGPNLLFLAGGIMLLLSGAAAVTIARRRAEDAELQASRA